MRFFSLSRATVLVAGFMAALAASAAPQPPPPPPWAPVVLIEECTAAMPRAHPWRARQLRQAMFRLRVSMSYRVVEGRLSPTERRSAMAAERVSYQLLAETCQPLLVSLRG